MVDLDGAGGGRRARADLRARASTWASTRATTRGRWCTRTRRSPPRSPACWRTSFRACTTRCSCSAGPSRWRPTPPSARRTWPRRVLDALEGHTAALMANHGAIAYGARRRCGRRALAAARVGVRGLLARRALGNPRTLGEERAPEGRGGGRSSAGTEARSRLNLIAMGVHVLDVLARPVEQHPRGPGRRAGGGDPDHGRGSAGGTAIVAAKLGAEVRSAGAIGTRRRRRHAAELLEREGVDTSLLVRRDDVQTSASVLPIRANGDRPAFHVIGANGSYGPDDVPDEALADDHAPAPRRARVHGRRGRRLRSWPARASRGRDLGRRAGARRAGPARLDRAGAAPARLPAAQRRARCWR